MYKNIKKLGFFLGSDKPRMLFFLLINVKMPTIVSILTFMSRKFSCSVELSMKKVLQPRGQAAEKSKLSVHRLLKGTHKWSVLFDTPPQPLVCRFSLNKHPVAISV